MNKLYFGDNLDVLREHIKDESVDLIYLDPPFNSNATYNVLFREKGGIPSEAQAEAFRDTWGWGPAAAIAYDEVLRGGGQTAALVASLRAWLGDTAMMAYLAMMTARLIELRRVLKQTGSIYLHCDPTASHYLKLIMDAIFTHQFYRNEVIWKRTGSHGGSKRWGPVHDTILFYTASDEYTWNRVYQEYDKSYLDNFYRFTDDRGRYRLVTLTGAGTRTGDSGKPWRGVDPTASGRHWAVPAKALQAAYPDRDLSKLNTQDKLELLDACGLVYWPQRGSVPQQKRYSDEAPGVQIQDMISDIPPLASHSKERLGYPTQKPLDLLERIIKASSNADSVILDPFCGCGTSVEAAERLGRNWIGIDVTHYAITLIQKRLERYENAKYEVGGRPTDLAGARDLARRDKYQFQWWAAWLLGAQTYETKKGADRGIDGNIYYANGPYGHGRIVISVKGGENLSPVMVRELAGVLQRENAEMGVLITLGDPSKAMLSDAAGQGFVPKSAHGRLPRVQIATIQDLLDGRGPKLPPIPQPLANAPRRKSAKERDQMELLLPFGGDGIVTEQGVFIDPRWIKSA